MKIRIFQKSSLLIGCALTVILQSAAKDELDDNALIEVVSHTSDTDQVYQAVLRAVDSIPESVKNTLVRNGVRWKIVSTLIDYDPLLAAKPARGWGDGRDFRYVAGTYSFRHKAVLIAEKALRTKDNVLSLKGHRLLTTLHETGHAFDWAMKHFSKTAEFRSAYNQDIAALNDEQRKKLQYYLQSNDAGPEETFAELFADVIVQQEHLPQERPSVIEFFPSCFSVVRNLLH